MRKEARILYICDPEIEASRILADHLHNALNGWNISISEAKLSTLLFESRKYNVVHLFLPLTSSKALQFVRRLSGKAKLIQTAIAVPETLERYDHLLDRLILFCESDRQRIQEISPHLQIDVIYPTVSLPDVNHLQHSSEVKKKFEIGERLLAVALNDVSNKQHFDSFLYVVREFNRRGEFRLIVPRFKTDPETLKWRKELQKQIENEGLRSTTLLQEDFDMHSLLDSADFAIHLRKDRDIHFDFPLFIVEAALSGKPVLSFNVRPYNEFIASFKKYWAFSTIEEMINEARDLHRNASNLEQLSTELARYARTNCSVDRVAQLYRVVYERVLQSQGEKVN